MSNDYIVATKADIKNPFVDRRSKDWNKRPVIEAGSRFIISTDSIRSTEHRYAWEGRRSELGRIIEASADKVEPTGVRELKAVNNCDWNGDEVLRILLKLGKIGPDDFAAVGNVPEDY